MIYTKLKRNQTTFIHDEIQAIGSCWWKKAKKKICGKFVMNATSETETIVSRIVVGSVYAMHSARERFQSAMSVSIHSICVSVCFVFFFVFSDLLKRTIFMTREFELWIQFWDQTIRFIESLFSIFLPSEIITHPWSHCIRIQGKSNQRKNYTSKIVAQKWCGRANEDYTTTQL